MDDALHKPSLYRWKRQTPKPSSRVYSRSQNCKTNDDIEDWIKKVERASDKATEAVFGPNHSSGRERGKYTALQTRQQVKEHDEVITEAQELLTNWMQEKLYLENNEEDDDSAWHQGALQAEVKREWDHLLGNSVSDWQLEVNPKSRTVEPECDPYAALMYEDETEAVDSILSHLLDKPVVKEDFLNDLGFEEKHKPDPRIKMELRHKQVKENREKRERELEKKRREQQEKKDSFHKAKLMVKKEERDRHLQSRREEQEIKREMANIRKQMAEERKKQQDLREWEERERSLREAEAQEELARQVQNEKRQLIEKQQTETTKQREMYGKLQRFQVKQSAKHLKCLQRHFSAWYQLVLQRRLQMGKARALSDWKALLKAWNAWRSYTQTRRIVIETQQYEQTVVDTHRKRHQAEHHYRCSLLRRYLTAWLSYVHNEQTKRHLESEQLNTRNKMMVLLEAAASGKLQSERESEVRQTTEHRNVRQDVVVEDLDDFFDQPSRLHPEVKQREPLASKSDSSLGSSHSNRSNRTRPNRLPSQAWQVNRQHVNLTNQEIANLTGGTEEENAQHSDIKVRRKFGTQPWMNTHYVVNNFENRYTAQQKILHDQQTQIKDQKRMIEDLQFHQKRQNHQEEIARQQIILQHLTKQGLSPMPDEEVAALQQGNKSALIGQSRSNINQSKDKDTNLVLETARTNSSEKTATTSRTEVSSLQTERTSSTSTTKSSSKYLQVLKNMEQRGEERRKLKAEREEKRRKEEEQRLALLEAQEEEMKRQIEEEKKARAQAYKEKKLMEKQKELEKNQNLARFRELTAKADAHYTRSIMKYRGIVPFRKLVTMAKNNVDRAEDHYKQIISRKAFSAWHEYSASEIAEKKRVADEMNNFLSVKRCFSHWKLYKHHIVIGMEKAKRFHAESLLRKILQNWADYATEEKFASWERERIAKEHYLWSLKKQSLEAWKRLPEETKLQAEREKRRNELRKKVAHLLPDFEGFVKSSTELL